MKNMFKAALFSGILLLSACGKETKTQETGQPNDTSKQTLRIATEGAYAPFNYTFNNGDLAGFDVDIANALCDKMAVTCQINAQEWDGIIPALKTDKFDAIISAMSVTPERSEQVSFSKPYFNNTLVFLAKNDSTFDPKNTNDIKSATIAVQGSTISSQYLDKTYPEVTPQMHNTLDNAFLNLASGRATVVLSDKLPALTWLTSDLGKDFSIKGDEIDIHDNFAIAVNKGNDELLGKFNQALDEIKADGTYDKLVQKHFGDALSSSTTKTATQNEETQTKTQVKADTK